MEDDRLNELLELQDGVVSHRQVVTCGGAYHDIRRMLRRRRWAVRSGGRVAPRDVTCDEQATAVELDGRVHAEAPVRAGLPDLREQCCLPRGLLPRSDS